MSKENLTKEEKAQAKADKSMPSLRLSTIRLMTEKTHLTNR